MVVAYYRLRGLGYGIAYHEEERRIVACYTESSDSRVAEILHELPVSHEHEHGHY